MAKHACSYCLEIFDPPIYNGYKLANSWFHTLCDICISSLDEEAIRQLRPIATKGDFHDNETNFSNYNLQETRPSKAR